MVGGSVLPSWLKWVYLAFVAILVPAYTWWHGLANFLWFSNVALLLGLLGVLLEDRRILSTQVIATLVPETVWIFDFIGGVLLGGQPPLGATAYMFDPEIPLFIQTLSLYHIVLPVLLLWLVWRLGYDQRALWFWIPAGWTILVATYFASPLEQNINWVFGPGGEPQDVMP
ncbi:hypothetical protein, partial [Aquisalimonas sp.]|uniref:hypothetical protein n=1 Tax=Aquisalimonas sp. TaxID=1872621 RepID=UPI0025C1CEAF